MDQHNIGNFIAAKRREKNLTQEQLSDRLLFLQSLPYSYQTLR